ncbi:MAG: Gfo/Idh/MocA family oxidoreductase [Alistipes sp.]|nr:Gfo/Idh/MocA family oxidoreductase [Alistipes sp.]
MKPSKTLFSTMLAVAMAMLAGCGTQKNLYQASVDYDIVDGVIILDEPERSPEQQSMIEFRAEPLNVVRVGFVGLGMRGPGAVERFTYIEGVAINALCDKYVERAERCQAYLTKAGMPEAMVYSGDEGYKALCESDDIDLVYIATPWQLHVDVAVYAMEHGKHVAIEVPSANTIEECWRLVDAAERNRVHCTILENCCYDHFELTTLNMARQGLFGEIIHAEGAYIHNLEPYWEHYADNWRLEYNQANNGDIYATHGIGPNCQALNIHRGDRLDYLVAMSTRSINGAKLTKELMGMEECKQGDQINTLIRTVNGCTIDMQHNVMTPRPYSRMYQLVGTEGYANKYPIEGYTFKLDQLRSVDKDAMPDIEDLNHHTFAPAEVVEAMTKQYKHPVQRQLVEGIPLQEYSLTIGGHGGMDFIMDYRLVYCLRHGLPLDMDVYDAAEWSSMGELTRISIENGSKPVKVPDFTRGDWDKVDGLTFYFAE